MQWRKENQRQPELGGHGLHHRSQHKRRHSKTLTQNPCFAKLGGKSTFSINDTFQKLGTG